MRRFWIVLLLAVVAFLAQPGVGDALPDDLFGLAVELVAILLAAVAIYAAVLAVTRRKAQGRTAMPVPVGNAVGVATGPPSAAISPPSPDATGVEDLKERIKRLFVRYRRP